MSAIQVSIVTHDNEATIEACLRSVLDETDGDEVAVDVVDNASRDATARRVREGFPDVRLRCSSENPGFGAAHNTILRAATAPLALVINPDARLQAGALARLRAALDDDPSLALVGPRLQSASGRPEVSYGAFPGVLADLRQQRRVQAAERGDPEALAALEAELERPFKPDWISGACMLGRTEVLQEVGLFDPRFFLYLEDVDLCLRLSAAGHAVGVEPRAVCIHERGVSEPDAEARRRHYRASRLAFEQKHGTSLTAFLYRRFRG